MADASTASFEAMSRKTVDHPPGARSAIGSTTPICDAGRGEASTPYPPTKSALNPEAKPFAIVLTTTTFCSDSVQTVFLQTARARIHHPSEPRLLGSASHPRQWKPEVIYL